VLESGVTETSSLTVVNESSAPDIVDVSVSSTFLVVMSFEDDLSDFISTTHIQDDKTADESSTMADEKYSLGRVNTTLTTSQGVPSRTHNRSDEPTTNT
jgi:hypothetical protein